MCDYAGQFSPPSLTGLTPSSGSTAGGYSVPCPVGVRHARQPERLWRRGWRGAGDECRRHEHHDAHRGLPCGGRDHAVRFAGIGSRAGSGGGDFEERGVELPGREVRVRVRGREPIAVPGPDRDQRRSLRRSRVGTYSCHDPRLGFTGATKVSFGGVAVATFAVKSPTRSSLRRLHIRARRAHRSRKLPCTRVRTRPTTSARCRSW